ncbi:MAG TPA: hypothetical protein VGN42_10135 [Pirellulales bacterium]|nr:hypothetical protein [Pirellulales bacterium]
MRYAIQIIDDAMCLVDEDGHIDDAVALARKPAARAQLQIWRAEYAINICDAYRKLHDYFADRWQHATAFRAR